MKKVLEQKELQWIEGKINSMTVDEKIAQITCVRFAAFFCGVGKMKNATQEEYEKQIDFIMEKYPVGNVFFGRELMRGVAEMDENAAKTRHIISYLQKKADVPMLIAGDVETGVGSAIPGLTSFPSVGILGAIDDEEISYKYGKLVARGSKAIGYNWSYGPVVDIARSWLNDATGRKISSDPDLIIKHANALRQGMEDENLGACAKHYPDNDDYRNSHIGLTLNTSSKEEWIQNEGRIYKELIEKGLSSVMIGHAGLRWAESLDEYEQAYAPATNSAIAVDGILRGELGFDGVAVSDGQNMAAYMNWKTKRERLINLYNAGIDMLLFPDYKDLEMLREAINDGEIPMEKINKSVERILKLKLQLELFNTIDTYDQMDEIEEEAKELARYLQTKCAICVKDHHKLLPLSKDKVKRALVLRLDNESDGGPCVEFINQLKAYGIEADVHTVSDFANWDIVPRLQKQVENGETWDAYFILYCHGYMGNNRPNDKITLTLWRVAGLVECVEPILVSFSSAYLLRDMPHIKTFITTYSNGYGDIPPNVVKAIFGDMELIYNVTYAGLEDYVNG